MSRCTSISRPSDLGHGTVTSGGVKARITKALILLVLSGLLLSLYSIAFARTPGMDFRHFYTAADMIRQGFGTDLYDVAVQRHFESQLFGQVGLVFDYPPVAALLYLPLSYLPIQLAYTVWNIVSCVLLVSSVTLINRSIGVFADSNLAVLVCFAFLPVHINFLQGQIDAVVLIAYAAALVLLKRNQPSLSGLALALGLVKFHLVLPIAVVMLLRRQWKFIRGFVGGGLLLLAVSIFVSGPRLLTAYPGLLLHLGSLPMSGVHVGNMPNLRGLAFRLFHYDPSITLTTVVLIILLIWAGRTWKDVETGFATAIIITLCCSYHLNAHDLILLLLPIGLLLRNLDWLSWSGVLVAVVAFPPGLWFALQKQSLPFVAIPVALLLVLILRQPAIAAAEAHANSGATANSQ